MLLGMMDVLVCVCVLWSLGDAILSANAQTDYFNLTTSNNESATVIPTLFDSTTPSGTSGTLSVSPGTSFTASTTDNPRSTEPTETVTEIFTSTEVNVSLETTKTATQPTPTISGSQPLPVSGSLPPPVTDVSSLCPCNLHEGRCDVNCCCDQDCVGDFKLFTECSVEKLVANTQMCVQDTARYSLSTAADGSARVQSSVTQEVNSDVFCIQTANYGAGLSFVPPEVPTDGNFDALFRRFAGFFFDSMGASDVTSKQDLQIVPGYKYGDIIQTQEDTGESGFLRLPTPAGSAHCTDANPAAFLQDQTSQCVRSFRLEQDCETLPSLNLQTYTSFRILSAKTGNITRVGVALTSVALQSLDGTRVLADPADGLYFGPALLGAGEGPVCNNVVLQVGYRVTYGGAGEIVGAAASVVLGAVDQSTLPILQEFTVTFVQDTEPRELPSSGNPGYVVGLPLVAGTRTAEGVVQSADRNGGLTLLRSPRAEQDCLGATGLRTPVRFGVNAASGCTLRLPEAANCSLVSELIFGVLRGPDFPKFVASFGNSPPNVVLDWVPIKNRTASATSDAVSCSIPLSLDLEVKWTKYGSLVNPQAQIVSVTEVIQTNTSSLSSLLGGSDLLLISTSVTFIDVSAAAQPGYRAPPTIDAKLPYDFFFPFV
ncbi:tectonic-1 [Anguilla rostrata]|uniref:tectonic-1 n=1 Tax=Anguilla rostrata TaxID=7938 RepID=UPI0030D27923